MASNQFYIKILNVISICKFRIVYLQSPNRLQIHNRRQNLESERTRKPFSLNDDTLQTTVLSELFHRQQKWTMKSGVTIMDQSIESKENESKTKIATNQ